MQPDQKEYTHILDSVPSLIAYVDTDLRYQYVNHAYANWAGMDAETLVGKNITEVLTGEAFEKIKPQIDRALAGQTVRFENHHRNQNGWRHLEVSFIPDIQHDNIVSGYTTHITDITENKRTATELSDFVENATIGLHRVNAQGIILWANQAELDMLGYTHGEYVGHSVREFYADPDIVDDMTRRLLNRESLTQYETALRCKDGSLRQVAVYSSGYWEDNTFIHTRCFTLDITSQKRAEHALRNIEEQYEEQQRSRLQAQVDLQTKKLLQINEDLRKSEERFHRMISEVQDYAIILLSRSGIIENWNKGAENIKGYTAAEAIGMSFRIFYPPQDQESGLPEKLLNIAYENGRATHEGWRVRKNGSRFWGSVVITALHDDQGNVVGFTKVTRDLTERKMAEEELKAKNQELEKMNQELSSFAYVSSHDLQEPLRKIQTFAHRILEVEENKLSDKSREYFKRIQVATTRMRMLIEDLLTYSRTNSEERKFVPTDLNQLVDDVRNELRETIEQKNAVLEYSNLPRLSVIPFQFHQLLMNILTNALKFTRRDVNPHIVIKAGRVAAKDVPELAHGRYETYHHITVADNGIGFSPEYNKRIFEVFQRLHGRAEYEGTGVGLAICRKIAENHGGMITAEGRENEGATFHIYLPA